METLGINPVLLVAQIISFLVLLFVMKKFLYGKIEQALEERRNKIKKTFSDSEELEKRLLNVEKELESKRKEVHSWSKQIEADAKKAAEEIKQDLVNKAKIDGNRELVKARERIELETSLAKKALISDVKEMSKDIINKVLAEKISSQDWQKKELNNSLKELKHLNSS